MTVVTPRAAHGRHYEMCRCLPLSVACCVLACWAAASWECWAQSAVPAPRYVRLSYYSAGQVSVALATVCGVCRTSTWPEWASSWTAATCTTPLSSTSLSVTTEPRSPSTQTSRRLSVRSGWAQSISLYNNIKTIIRSYPTQVAYCSPNRQLPYDCNLNATQTMSLITKQAVTKTLCTYFIISFNILTFYSIKPQGFFTLS